MELNNFRHINLSFDELNNLFPFYILLNEDFKIISIGQSLKHLFPISKKEDFFFDSWTIEKPSSQDSNSILTNKLTIISNNSNNNLKFKGQFEKIESSNQFLFLGTPWFQNTDQLIENNLTVSNFAIHDSMFDLLHVLKKNDIVNNELKEIVDQLNSKKKTLELEQASLRKRELMLSAIAEATDELLTNLNLKTALNNTFKIIGGAIELNGIALFQSIIADISNIESIKASEWINDSTVQLSIDFDIDYSVLTSRSNNDILIDNSIISPVFVKDVFWGFLVYQKQSFENEWSTTEKSLIKSLTNSISSAIERSESSKELFEMASFSMESPNPILRIDMEGKLILRNVASEKINSIQLEGKERGDKLLFKFLPKILNKHRKHLLFEITSGKKFYLVTAMLSSSNDYINIYLNDISKQKEAEFEILKSNEQLNLFKILINNSSDAVQVSLVNGQLFYINKTASERLGIEIEKCQYYYVSDFEEIFENESEWANHIDQLKTVEFLTIEGKNINNKTGKTFPVEVTVKYIEINEIGYIIANSRDITERKINEEKLKIQEEKYRNIITNMNLGLLEVDLEEKIEYCNQNFLDISGYTFDEIKGKKANELFSVEETKPIIEEKIKLREAGKSDSYEIAIRDKNGDLKWWFVSGGPNKNDKNEIIGSIGIHLDITKQKELERELEAAVIASKAASEAKEAFLANMSHEIRTPLNGIIGMIRELSSNKSIDEQYPLIENAKNASKHLLSIINNILDISKIEAGELAVNKMNFNLFKVLNDIKSIFINECQFKKINFELIALPEIDAVFVGDEIRIRQVLLNIIGNALKFTHKGSIQVVSKIVKSFDTEFQVEFKIIDSGIGMSTEFQKNIFTKFHQADNSNERQYGGTGLGMVITKELVDLMEGQIAIESELNKGTTITIQLTLGKGESLIEEKKLTNQVPGKEIVKVLLVEDNEINRVVAKMALSGTNLDITEAENGVEALEILENSFFDLILMDLQMPILGGIETTLKIREFGIQTPIIALTANAFKTEIQKCKEAGMNDYIVKPFEKEDFLNVIFRSLEQKASSNEEAHFSLVKLNEMSGDNEGFIQNMLAIFKRTILKSMYDLDTAIENGDFESVKQIVHKIKPSIHNLEIKSVYQEIDELEQGELNLNEIQTKVNKLKSIIKLVLVEMEK
ncbi:MAG: PAS domain S-box protein [Fluviicola sp.]|nr:PAS domain S-box protein [Fluviicola sp.]